MYAPFPATVEIVRLLDDTAAVEFRLQNLTAGTIPEQSLTITLPRGVDLQAGGAALGCARQDEITYGCTIRGMAESDSQQEFGLTLTAGPDAAIGTGTITVSVTGHQASAFIVIV